MPPDWLQELEEEQRIEGRQGRDGAGPKTNGHDAAETRPPLLLSEWLARELDEPDFLSGEWLSTSSRVLIVGPTGLGKTLFGLDFAISLAAGVDFLHWRTRRRARVLYVDGEMGRRQLRKRLRDAVTRTGQKPDSLLALSKEDFENMPPLNTPDGEKWINGFISAHGPFDLIILDNIQALLVGDMREEEQWANVLPWVRSLTRRSIGQIWFHHTGHDETKSYGSKAREWQMDTVAMMERKTIAGADVAFTLKFTKARERTPDNRTDFEDVTLSLKGDQWSHDVAVKKPSGQAKIALEQLQRAIDDAGEKPPANNHIPGTIKAVSIDLWDRYCKKASISQGNTKKAHDVAFKRAFLKLQTTGLIGVWGPWVWLV